MHKGMFTEDELSYLRSLDAVDRAEPLRITYSKQFKREFMRRYRAGERPKAIFESAGLSESLIGYKRIERACAHWREAESKDALCLTSDRIPTRDDIRARERRRASERVAAVRASRDRRVAELEERLAKQRARSEREKEKIIASQAAEIAALKAQVRALKANGTLERKTRRAPGTTRKSERFEVIFRLRGEDPAFNVAAACEALEVSRSGYYEWVGDADARAAREAEDERDRDLIAAAMAYRGFNKGTRQVRDRLRRDEEIVMNRKKIQRIQRKFGMQRKRRRRKPYRPMGADGQPKVADNVVNGDFRRGEALKVISTDITYLPSAEGFTYLSGIIDCETDVLLSHVASESLEEAFVLETYDGLKGLDLPDDIWACSDQGVHYTARPYRDKLAELGINQSMSRKACCWDNAPIESFWGVMKRDIGPTGGLTHDEIVELVDDYVDYYNNERGKERLGWLTPSEYAESLA
jgi:putative transposase